ncbi:hypothetical protein GCM10009838_79530 [Catenulispora subtropica]|uniref:Uncharacterized protein n=1 Tax=Catenulispora subtropica TaxID=450798 RepID=A0ABN2T945_9ACTN
MLCHAGQEPLHGGSADHSHGPQAHDAEHDAPPDRPPFPIRPVGPFTSTAAAGHAARDVECLTHVPMTSPQVTPHHHPEGRFSGS